MAFPQGYSATVRDEVSVAAPVPLQTTETYTTGQNMIDMMYVLILVYVSLSRQSSKGRMRSSIKLKGLQSP